MGFSLKKEYYPVAFLALIGIAAYILYSGVLTPKIDLQKYKEVCDQYRSATAGSYSEKQLQSLVTKINYLIPGAVSEIKDPLKREIKACGKELASRLKK